MEYTIDVSNLPEHVSMTPMPRYDSLEAKVADAPVKAKPSLWKRVAVYGALLLGLAGAAACDGGNNPPGPINPIPSSYSVADNMTPADGSIVTGSSLEVGVQTPAVPAACAADADCAAAAAGGLDVSYEIVSDNATPGNSSDDVVLGTDSQTGVPFGSYTSTTVDLTGVPDGAGIEARVSVTGTDADGVDHSVDGSVGYVFDAGSVNPVRVTGCNVNNSAVGTSLAIACNCESSAGAITGWDLTGGPAGAFITRSGAIGSPILGAGDVNNWTYDVTCTDGTNTSDVYTFTAPVDIDRATLEVDCNDGTEHTLVQPEGTLDAEAEDCATEAVVKPTVSGGEFLVDIRADCVVGAYEALRADEREANTHYNNGTTTATACPDGIAFAQGRWHKN